MNRYAGQHQLASKLDTLTRSACNNDALERIRDMVNPALQAPAETLIIELTQRLGNLDR